MSVRRFEPSGFFVLRTPLLPFDAYLAWEDGLEAPQAQADRTRLADAIARDVEKLRARLRTLLTGEHLREALFVASPSLFDSLPEWLKAPDSERGQKVER